MNSRKGAPSIAAFLTKRRAVIALVFFAIVLSWLIPKRVIVRGDDFGYLQSVAFTIKAETLVQSDWLGPFNIPLPLVSATIFAASHSMWLATHGLLFVLGLVNFFLLRKWMEMNGVTDPWVAFVVVICPVWLNKAVEFTGVALGITLFLAALVAWRRGWRLTFFALVAIGVMNRQSMVCLLAFPFVELIRHWMKSRRPDWTLVIGGLGTVALLAALVFIYPSTYARTGVSNDLASSMSWSSLIKNLGLGWIILNGLQSFWGCLRGESLRGNFQANLSRPVLPLIKLILAVAVLVFGGAVIRVETPGVERFWLLFAVVMAFFGAWLGGRKNKLTPEASLGALIYVILVSMRGQWWDYYFLEPALLVIATMGSGCIIGATDWFRRAVVFSILAVSIFYIPAFSRYLHAQESKLVVYEKALRAGDLRVTELSEAPFGYLGWKLFDHAKVQGDVGLRLSDFLKYVEAGRSGWMNGRLYVFSNSTGRSIHPTGKLVPLGDDHWANSPFPLSDEEWRAYLNDRTSAKNDR